MKMDDLISREEALKVCDKYNGQGYVWSCIRGDIEKLPSAQPTQNNRVNSNNSLDTISRQAAIDALMEKFKRIPTTAIRAKDALEALPSAQPELIEQAAYVRGFEQGRIQGKIDAQPNLQLTCNKLATDTISRQEAIDAVCMEWCGVKYQECEHPFDIENDESYWCDGCETVLKTLPNLPSAQPEIIRCKYCKHYGVAWLKKDGTDDRRYKSSVCLRGKYAVEHKPDWYCGDAERREE